MEALYYSWGGAAKRSSYSVSTLRRLVEAGIISRPLQLSAGRVGFEAKRFDAEICRHVEHLNHPTPRSAA
jgi:hypothetical protein